MSVAQPLPLVAALLFFIATSVQAAPVIFLVRHAEKATTDGNDPGLSAAGQLRAEALAKMLKDSEISAIFTTEFKRTQETAVPIANAAGVAPTVIPAKDTQALVEKLRSLQGNALIVGHSNTIPEVVKALGIETAVNIREDDYSELIIVVLADKPQLLPLHYPN